MKQHFIFLTLLIISTNCFGQIQPKLVFHTAINPTEVNNKKYYSKTDFSIVDTLSLWNYKLDTTYKGKENDSIKQFGVLIFWRIKPIDDSISKHIYNQLWTPFIMFDIYNVTDTNYCFQKSTRTRHFSSCVPPQVGGDIIIVDKFVLLNRNVCLSCQRYDTKIDYCRPVINYVFSKIDRSKITTIESLTDQFIITQGQLPRGEKREVISNE
jgi:hypothetical protein